MTTPTPDHIAAMRAVLADHEQRTGEQCRTTGDAWLALAVHARMHKPEWGGWMTLENHRSPWLRSVLD